MRLAGLQKLTLLDYPGEVACTLFTRGCSLRCPFCQNPELVLPEQFPGEDDDLAEDDFFAFLDRRRGRLSGVVVSGGEPTMQKDLPAFLARIREKSFLVKLDTNGMNPDVLRRILDTGLVDYVAMDVKNSPAKYGLTCGYAREDSSTGGSTAAGQPGIAGEGAGRNLPGADLWERAGKSIAILGESPVLCEFRTTVARGLHTEEDIVEMARQLPAGRPWYLQQFVDSGDLVGTWRSPGLELRTPSPKELDRMRKLASEILPDVFIRGV